MKFEFSESTRKMRKLLKFEGKKGVKIVLKWVILMFKWREMAKMALKSYILMKKDRQIAVTMFSNVSKTTGTGNIDTLEAFLLPKVAKKKKRHQKA